MEGNTVAKIALQAATYAIDKPYDYQVPLELLDTLRAQGILVRWWGKPRIEDYLRITIGTEEEMEQLIQVLRQTLGRDKAQK